jgi:hypothetical protein
MSTRAGPGGDDIEAVSYERRRQHGRLRAHATRAEVSTVTVVRSTGRQPLRAL